MARAFGLTSATGLVIGTVIGAGVFTMPAVLVGAGTVSLAVLGVIAVGAMVLAVLFGQLMGGSRTPTAGSTRTPGTSSVISPVT
jgi:APA family basic amino acid/polyamine antiporter